MCCDCHLWPQWFPFTRKAWRNCSGRRCLHWDRAWIQRSCIHLNALLISNHRARFIWSKMHKIFCRLKKYCDIWQHCPGYLLGPHIRVPSHGVWSMSSQILKKQHISWHMFKLTWSIDIWVYISKVEDMLVVHRPHRGSANHKYNARLFLIPL